MAKTGQAHVLILVLLLNCVALLSNLTSLSLFAYVPYRVFPRTRDFVCETLEQHLVPFNKPLLRQIDLLLLHNI